MTNREPTDSTLSGRAYLEAMAAASREHQQTAVADAVAGLEIVRRTGEAGVAAKMAEVRGLDELNATLDSLVSDLLRR